MDAFRDLKRKLRLGQENEILLGNIPMILTPRWFFVNIQKELEKMIGLKRTKEVYYNAAYMSAYQYCMTQRRRERLKGTAPVHRYLASMSIRGWGRFEIVKLEPTNGIGIIRLYGSGVSKEWGRTRRAVCHWVPGALAGAIQETLEAHNFRGRVQGKEIKCRSKGDAYCEFLVKTIGKLKV